MQDVQANDMGVPVAGHPGENIGVPAETIMPPDVSSLEEVVDEDIEYGEPVDFSGNPIFDPKNDLRVVIVGGSDRLDLATDSFGSGITSRRVSHVSFPKSLFAAGMAAASADILIFDVLRIDILDLQDLVQDCRLFNPRAVIVVLLEDGMPEQTVPESLRVHLVITTPFSAYGVAQRIDSLMFGPQPHIAETEAMLGDGNPPRNELR